MEIEEDFGCLDHRDFIALLYSEGATTGRGAFRRRAAAGEFLRESG